MNKILTVVCKVINRILPIIQNTVFFISFDGLYNDNPKRISILLHEKYPDTKIVWLQSKRAKDNFPSYILTVKENTFDYYKYLYRSKVIIDNYVGAREFFGNKKLKRLNKVIYFFLCGKRKGQLNISTWHGTPLKKIGGDTLNAFITDDFITSCTYLTTGFRYTGKCMETAYFNKINIRYYGSPRNDALFENDNDVKVQIDLPSNKKIVLYAPTFRKNVELSGVRQVKDINVEKLLSLLSERFGGEWIFVFRVHQLVQDQINAENLCSPNMINGNMHDDMADYLKCADVLITDYSGSLFDFALTGKPCFLYAPDLNEYRDHDRGLYLDYNKLPIPKATRVSELYDKIKLFDEKEFKKDNSLFLDMIGNVEDGEASSRVVESIMKFIKNGEIEDESINS